MIETYTMTKKQFVENLYALRRGHGSINLILVALLTTFLFVISYFFFSWKVAILQFLLTFFVKGFSTVLWVCFGLSALAVVYGVCKRGLDCWFVKKFSRAFQKGPYCFSMKDEGLVIGLESRPVLLLWNQVYQWDDVGDSFVIYTDQRKMIMIPRHYVARQYGLAQTIECLVKRVGEPRVINSKYQKL